MKCLPDSDLCKTARFEVVGLVWFGFFATCLSCLYSFLNAQCSVLSCVVLHAQCFTRSEMSGTCQVRDEFLLYLAKDLRYRRNHDNCHQILWIPRMLVFFVILRLNLLALRLGCKHLPHAQRRRQRVQSKMPVIALDVFYYRVLSKSWCCVVYFHFNLLRQIIYNVDRLRRFWEGEGPSGPDFLSRPTNTYFLLLHGIWLMLCSHANATNKRRCWGGRWPKGLDSIF